MKKKLVYFLLLITLLFPFLGNVEAQSSNADDHDASGSRGGQVGGTCLYGGRDLWCNRWMSVHMSVSIVYYNAETKTLSVVTRKDKNHSPMKKYYYLSDMYGGDGDRNCVKNHWCDSPSEADGVKRDAQNNIWKHQWMSRAGTSVLFDSDMFHKDTVNYNNSDVNVRRNTFINFVKREFGYDIATDPEQLFVKESCEVDVNNPGNCYHKSGYRLKAEIHGINGSGHSRSLKTIDYWGQNLNTAEMTDASNSMTIEWPDINYGCAYGTTPKGKGKVCARRESDSLSCLRDGNRKTENKCGWGIWLVDITRYVQPGYDYSLDMACVNCDSTISDSKAVVLQDTTNWEAIEASPTSPIQRAQDYFYKKDYKTYCREEYHVYFPNENNRIKVQLGRYFTLNARQTSENNQNNDNSLEIVPADIPDFKPVKVKKIRQCRKGDLTGFDNATKGEKCMPDVEVYYKNEKAYEYNKDCTKKLDQYGLREISEIKNGQLTQTYTAYYTLPSDVYRYIRKVDGKSIHTSVKGEDAVVDLKIGNFPIAFKKSEEMTENQKVADIKFTFTLNKCKYSKFYNAYISKNNYFSSKTVEIEDNIYKKYKTGKSDANNNINDSACVKLFGNVNAASKCIDARQANKMGNCFTEFPKANNTGKCSFGNSSYSCAITDCSNTDPDYNPVTKKCSSGKPPVTPGDDTCNQNTAGKGKYANLKWNPDTHKCDENAEDKCKKNCEEVDGKRACCIDENGEPYCGEFMGTKIICPGKPDIVPGDFAKNLVYRTIDINHPFTDQNGVDRKTGDNWCDSTTKDKNCSFENNTVTTVIKGSSTDENDAMYYVELDSDKISAIRAYNNRHNYDDFTLTCDTETNNCIMSNEVYGLIGVDRNKSTCAGRSLKSEFSTCIETK